MVHNLYTKLIQKDLENSKQKTEAQLSIEKLNVETAQIGIEELLEENKVLKRNIQRAKQVLAEKQDQIKKKERKEAEKEKLGQAGRTSEVDSHSLKDVDGHSMASFSALGGYASQRVDIKKVEQINQNLQLILHSRQAFDAMLLVLKMYKAALKNVGRCTVFVLNRYL